MSEDSYDNQIITELQKLKKDEWIDINELARRVDPNDTHMVAKINELIDYDRLLVRNADNPDEVRQNPKWVRRIDG